MLLNFLDLRSAESAENEGGVGLKRLWLITLVCDDAANSIFLPMTPAGHSSSSGWFLMRYSMADMRVRGAAWSQIP